MTTGARRNVLYEINSYNSWKKIVGSAVDAEFISQKVSTASASEKKLGRSTGFKDRERSRGVLVRRGVLMLNCRAVNSNITSVLWHYRGHGAYPRCTLMRADEHTI